MKLFFVLKIGLTLCRLDNKQFLQLLYALSDYVKQSPGNLVYTNCTRDNFLFFHLQMLRDNFVIKSLNPSSHHHIEFGFLFCCLMVKTVRLSVTEQRYFKSNRVVKLTLRYVLCEEPFFEVFDCLSLNLSLSRKLHKQLVYGIHRHQFLMH